MQSNYEVIDLSRPIHTKMPVFPAISKTYLGIFLGHKDTLRPGGISSQANILVMCDHAGTHIDSPLHFNPEGTGIDRMPVDLMVGNAVMQDYSFKKNAESITSAEVEENLKKINVNPRDLKYILFKTGAGEYYDTDEYLSKYLEVRADAVEWMLDRGILVFGVDASTCDHAIRPGNPHAHAKKGLLPHGEPGEPRQAAPGQDLYVCLHAADDAQLKCITGPRPGTRAEVIPIRPLVHTFRTPTG